MLHFPLLSGSHVLAHTHAHTHTYTPLGLPPPNPLSLKIIKRGKKKNIQTSHGRVQLHLQAASQRHLQMGHNPKHGKEKKKEVVKDTNKRFHWCYVMDCVLGYSHCRTGWRRATTRLILRHYDFRVANKKKINRDKRKLWKYSFYFWEKLTMETQQMPLWPSLPLNFLQLSRVLLMSSVTTFQPPTSCRSRFPAFSSVLSVILLSDVADTSYTCHGWHFSPLALNLLE